MIVCMLGLVFMMRIKMYIKIAKWIVRNRSDTNYKSGEGFL